MRMWRSATVLLLAVCLCLLVPCVALAETADPVTEMEARQVIIALGAAQPGSTNEPSEELTDWQAAMVVLQPYLAAQTEGNISVLFSPVTEKAHRYYERFTLPEQLAEASEHLAGMKYQKRTSKSYSGMMEGIFSELSSCAENTEFWLVDGYPPVYVSDEKTNPTAQSMLDMLEEYPSLRVQFLWLLQEEVWAESTEEGTRIDCWLRQRMPDDAGRIVTRMMQAGVLMETEYLSGIAETITELIDGQVYCPPAVREADTQDQKTWSIRYVHEPWKETGDTMLLLDSSIEPAEIMLFPCDEAQQSVPVTEIRLGSMSLLYASDLARGEYEVRFVYSRKQKNEPQLCMQPMLPVRDTDAHVRVTLADAENGWFRDEQRVHIIGDAVNLSAQAWQPILLANDYMLMDALFVEENTDGYVWEILLPNDLLTVGEMEIKPMLRLAAPSTVTLEGDAVKVHVENRAPTIAEGAENQDFDVFFGLPAMPAGSVEVDLASLFGDEDGDNLIYRIQQCTEVVNMIEAGRWHEADLIETESFTLFLEENRLVYTAGSIDDTMVKVLVQASDGHDVWSAPVELIFRQCDAQKLLSGLRFARMNNHMGKLGEETIVTFALTEESMACMPLLEELCRQYGLTLHWEIGYQLSVNGATETGKALAVSMDENQTIGFSITLPATIKTTTYRLSFTDAPVTFADIPMPDLMANVKNIAVKIVNNSPKLHSASSWVRTAQKGEIQDFFNNEEATLRLSDLLDRPFELQWMDEKEGELDFSIRVAQADGPVTIITEDGEEMLPDAEGCYLLARDEHGVMRFDAVFVAKGTYKLELRAVDAGAARSVPEELVVEITSQQERILFVAGCAMLILVLCVVIVIVVIRLCKPKFKNICVQAWISDADVQDDSPVLPLKGYQKKSVSAFVIAMALQQPIADQKAIKLLASIEVSPSRKSLVRITASHNVRKQVTKSPDSSHMSIDLGNNQRLSMRFGQNLLNQGDIE